jgi:hypothetical protein
LQDEDFSGAPPVDPPFVSDPAQHRDRRPELYSLLAQPQPDAFDFFYARDGVESWPRFETRRSVPDV